jgi:hypothetical protein
MPLALAERAQLAIKTIAIVAPVQRQAQWIVSPATALGILLLLALRGSGIYRTNLLVISNTFHLQENRALFTARHILRRKKAAHATPHDHRHHAL